jgi:ankyrin repeat protein
MVDLKLKSLHNYSKDSLLHVAIREGDATMVRWLLQKGADPNQETERFPHYLPLYLAAVDKRYSCAAIVEALLEDPRTEADAGISFGDDETVLCKLIKCNGGEDFELVDLLLAHGASPNWNIEAKCGALHLAAKLDKPKVLERLLKAESADIESKSDRGCTPLLVTAQHGCHASLEFLISEGSYLDAVDDEASSALHYSAYGGHKKIVEELLEGGASVNHLNSKGKTPLDVIIEEEAEGPPARNRELAYVYKDILAKHSSKSASRRAIKELLVNAGGKRAKEEIHCMAKCPKLTHKEDSLKLSND